MESQELSRRLEAAINALQYIQQKSGDVYGDDRNGEESKKRAVDEARKAEKSIRNILMELDL